MKQLICILCLLLFLCSCSEEIARIDLHPKNPTTSINVSCEKDRQIDFYLDCDIEYDEQPLMVMDFEFFKGQTQILKGGLDPLMPVSIENESKSEINGITRWSFYGKLDGNFIPTDDTIFTIKPTLIKNNNTDLKIKKIELVLVR